MDGSTTSSNVCSSSWVSPITSGISTLHDIDCWSRPVYHQIQIHEGALETWLRAGYGASLDSFPLQIRHAEEGCSLSRSRLAFSNEASIKNKGDGSWSRVVAASLPQG